MDRTQNVISAGVIEFQIYRRAYWLLARVEFHRWRIDIDVMGHPVVVDDVHDGADGDGQRIRIKMAVALADDDGSSGIGKRHHGSEKHRQRQSRGDKIRLMENLPERHRRNATTRPREAVAPANECRVAR